MIRIPSRLVSLCLAAVACDTGAPDGPGLSKSERQSDGCCLLPGQFLPNSAERDISGQIAGPVRRGSSQFLSLVRVDDENIVFKDEEGTGADRHMTRRLRARLLVLSGLIEREWPNVRLRVTEAWDETQEHARGSLHYEGRAADITTSDLDRRKLGRLAKLAVSVGFDWVYFEDGSHVHVSVRP